MTTLEARFPARMLVIAAILLAFALRLPEPANPWPGLYHDEAYAGLDAVGVLDGELKLYFPANNGREPLFIYLVSAFVAALGRTPAAIRLASAVIGTATVAAAYAMGAALFGRRHGVLAAWLMAVLPWSVILGRVGFRAGSLALVLAMSAAATAWGLRGRGTRWLAIGGALAGLTLYTYTAARVVPLLAIGFVLWAAIIGGRRALEPWPFPRDVRRGATVWLLAALVLAGPMLLLIVIDTDATLGRSGQVSIFNADVNGGDPAAALAANLRGTLGMLVAAGDFIPRHNIPDRPVFGVAAGALALLGAVWAIVRSRNRWPEALLVIWLVVMALPTLLAENAPHFLRAVGLLPVLVLLPAMGADLVARGVRRVAKVASSSPRVTRTVPMLAWWVLAIIAVAGELYATREYDRATAVVSDTAADLWFAFETGAAGLAQDANITRGAGWRGGWGVPAGSDEAASAPAPKAAHVWLDRRLRDGWASVPYLVPADEVILVDRYDPILASGDGTAYLVPSGLDQSGLWSQLPSGTEVRFLPGLMERGDLDEEARSLYVMVVAAPAEEMGSPAAIFENSMALQNSEVRYDSENRSLDITSRWHLAEPIQEEVTGFFQVLDGDMVVAQSDAPLGSGLFGVPYWRPGHVVVEERAIHLPGIYDPERHTVIAGLYVDDPTTRVPVEGGSGQLATDYVIIAP